NLSYDKNITKVAVYNVLGQEIMIKNYNTNQSQLDMSSLANGTYLVKVTADNAEKTVKVIKQ
ncbi:MAG: T9SS type A sorting domain-containing protein, partial [Flavobacterium sp.]